MEYDRVSLHVYKSSTYCFIQSQVRKVYKVLKEEDEDFAWDTGNLVLYN